MFRPVFGKIATEPMDEPDGFVLAEGLVVDGSLHQVPDVVFVEPDPVLPRVGDWDFEEQFLDARTISQSTTNWYHYPEIPPDSPPAAQWNYTWTTRQYRWENDFPPEWLYIQSLQIDGVAPGTYIEETGEFALVDHEAGWTAEMRFMMPRPPGYKTNDGTVNDLAELVYHENENQIGIEFDDGTVAGKLYLGMFHTLVVPETGETFTQALAGSGKHLYSPRVPYGYLVRPRTLRLTMADGVLTVSGNSGISGQHDLEQSQPFPNQVESYAQAASSGVEAYKGGLVSSMSWIPPANVVYMGSSQQNPGDRPFAENPDWLNPDLMSGNVVYTLKVTDLSPSSGRKHFRIGRIGGEAMPYGFALLDTFKVRAEAFVETGEFVTTWGTGELVSYSPVFRPAAPVTEWTKAVYKAENLAGGTIHVRPEVSTGGAYTPLAEVELTDETTEQDLTAAVPAGTLADEIRFRIRQQAASPDAEGPRLEGITVVLDHGTRDLVATPTFGPAAGGNAVTLTLDGPGTFTPASEVYVDGVKLDAGAVTYVDESTILAVMPAHDPGDVAIRVTGSSYFSRRPYTYVASYDVEADGSLPVYSLEDVFRTGPSPFRIVPRAPEGALPVALLGVREASVATHFSLTDLSGLEAANRVGYGLDVQALRTADTGEILTFDAAVDTEEVYVTDRVSNRPAGRGRPLFMKYLVGRKRLYVRAPAAASADDIAAIRAAIRVGHETGEESLLDWDIEAGSLDAFGEPLPASVFSVVLFLEDAPSRTLFVTYRAADPADGYGSDRMKREVVNPVPAFSRTGERMKVSATADPSGAFDMEVTS